ncbi:MAG: dihydrolipoamide acetyltransferase family protein [Acidimicrobiia bacterium]|nr:MAG: dihydrolipoamide acetyltransferase family protein [Acidimicrobiia bacterium]
MPHEFRLPDIGEGLTEAEIVEWSVAVGDEVEVDQLIVEIETAKTTVEITSTHAGTVLSLGGRPGDTINVGEMLFVVGQKGEKAGGTTLLPPDPAAPSPLQRGDKRGRAMPIVRKLASQKGIDLATVEGTGPGGIITRSDVQNAIAPESTETIVPLSRTRRAIARHMTESWTTIPHVTVQADVRAERLMAALAGSAGQLSLEALTAAAVLPLLVQYPEFNAVIRGDSVAYRSEFNLGFAVDAQDGLLVVVVREADTLSVQEIATEFSRLAESAHTGGLTPAEVTGQTFTISNIGALGGGHGTPIIPMGTSAILSIGKAKAAPVVDQGIIEVGTVAPVDLSYDHRLIDGALGQRFLSSLTSNLEQIDEVLDR